MRIQDIPIHQIHRPLLRQNDPEKVQALMASIQEIGLQEPIDVLEVDGKYYGFSGCHRYEDCTRLGHETIRCRVRRALNLSSKCTWLSNWKISEQDIVVKLDREKVDSFGVGIGN